MIAAVGLTMLAVLWLRDTVDVNILPDRNPLFVTMSDGSIRNGYTIRVMNKEHAPKSYELGLRGAEGSIAVQGVEGQGRDRDARPHRRTAWPRHHVFVQLPRAAVTGEQSDLDLTPQGHGDRPITTYDTIFRGPKR